MCGAPSTIVLNNIVAVLRRSPATVEHQDRHHAVVLTELFPRHSAGLEYEGRHRAERVQELGGAMLSVLDRSGREDVRLHQPRCANASAIGLQGYVDHTLPSRCYASP